MVSKRRQFPSRIVFCSMWFIEGDEKKSIFAWKLWFGLRHGENIFSLLVKRAISILSFDERDKKVTTLPT